jgi:hypothetical protein
MKLLILLLIVILSGCIATYNVETNYSYWEHPDKISSSDDYQKCNEDNNKDKEETKKCMVDQGWRFVVATKK